MNFNFGKVLMGSGDVVSAFLETRDRRNPFESQNLFYIVERLIRNSSIYPRFRIYVLNQDETKAYEIPQEDILTGGSYQENYQNGQRRTLSFSLNNETGKYTPSIHQFWVNTKFAFEIGLQIPDYDDGIIWFRKGVFSISSAQPSNTAERKTINFSLKDKFGLLEDASAKIETTYTIPVGTEIKSVIQDILSIDVGTGVPLDPKPFIYHRSFEGRVTQQTLTGEAGSTWGKLLLDLASMLSAEMFYNAEGHLVVVPVIETIDTSTKPTIFDFFSNEGDFQNNDYSLEFSDIYNKVIVLGTNINGGTVRGVSVNDNPESPININRIGIRTADIINDSAITTEAIAKERADYELRKMSIIQTSLSNTVYFNPLLSVNNLISLTDNFFRLQKQRLILQSISYSLNYDGVMSISSANVDNLNFVL